MANYINITLDTIGPSGVGILINGDSDTIISTTTNISVTCSDADLTGYQMKIWGTADAPFEKDALWETFQSTKNITLPTGDGLKTVYVKVRDDVWNESVTVSDTVTLYEKLPTVINFVTNKSKLSLVDGMDLTSGSFALDEDIDAIKLMIVQNINDRHDAKTNISIPTTNGSYLLGDASDKVLSNEFLNSNSYVDHNAQIIMFYIYAADIVAVAPGDGVKILKVFVRSAETGNWSV